MASQFFRTPISAVSLTDRNRQWFKSHVGTHGREILREGAPCAEVTRSTRTLVIPDMREDPQFADCLLAKSGIRFYAGSPLITRDGFVLGAMCVLDQTPRTVTTEEVASLNDFAAMVMSQIELEHDFGRVDPLSGFPNRNQFVEDLQDDERHNPDAPRIAVLVDLIDPNQLSDFVNVLGTVYIDDLVKSSVRSIKRVLGRKRGIYHVGTASFALLLNPESKWRAAGIDIRISVNVSARNLEEPDFSSELRKLLREHGVPTNAIELEFTESALIRNRSRVIAQLQDVRSMGIELAIDDFGTGYSSFSYLNKLPATTVKIDQSFIRTLAQSTVDQKLVRSMITMSHDIGYRAVAEGVETAEIYSLVAEAGCDEIQGYFISRPLTPELFEAWLKGRKDAQIASALKLLSGDHPLLSAVPIQR